MNKIFIVSGHCQPNDSGLILIADEDGETYHVTVENQFYMYAIGARLCVPYEEGPDFSGLGLTNPKSVKKPNPSVLEAVRSLLEPEY